ncbi:3-hydroxyisobutyryl-CoA hydrolase [Lithohypha guttulata]|uniref:3-hydroxyisobutyryl-CoA hydrolase n=1 Tax=Lithohypha guttulata TaxID=1690604 RepID=UPI002DE13743|nr:3-hydroxyisobutyryl-CoA hydrolase [Lithohypha guttulata]
MASSSRQYTYVTTVPKEEPGNDPDDVLFNSLYGVRTIELNRPKKLNSLNGSMARKILPRLKEWEKSQMANVIMITGAGEKAFCAGGDVAELAKNNATKEGQLKSTNYFALEYQLDHTISTYSKPYIAVMDGITMGGGVGLSVHAPFRIATERTTFAMPETTIGFFPDVGGSFFLSRLDGEVGTYLALTSERLQGVQAMYAGIATHYLDSSVLQPLTTRLSELNFRDHADLQERLSLIDATISEFSTNLPSPDSYGEKLKNGNISGELREAIDRCFKFNSIDKILEALRTEADGQGRIADWAKATAKTIAMRSPTSLKVTLKQLRLGKHWKIGETFIREHEMAARFMQHPDFTEGVSARLINKPPTEPKWQPATLEEVKESDVDTFFALPEGVEPVQLIQPSQNARDDYRDYPHATYALPREEHIAAIVREHGRGGKQAVMQEVLTRWNNKLGVQEKMEDVFQRKCQLNGREVQWKEQQKASL